LKTYTVWTDAVSCGLEELQDAGVTVQQISQVLLTVPFNIKTKSLIEYLSSKGLKIMIASDANTFYINEILSYFNILHHFERIYTNFGTIKDGKLKLARYVPVDSSHGCSRCPANLCKGIIVNDLKKEFNKIYYFGDGRNDFCPSLKLSGNDYVFPRLKRPLFDLIRDSTEVKAKTFAWESSEDLLVAVKGIMEDDSKWIPLEANPEILNQVYQLNNL
jgi:pyridoxal phosphate phosphatase PHOSPHO2